MSAPNAEEQTLVPSAQPEGEATENKATRRTPKRKVDAFQKESEELLKTLGVTVDMEDGRRRTRSSARGAPATPTTPSTPPAKRARAAPGSAKRGKQADDELPDEEPKANKGTPKKRGHAEPKKLLGKEELPKMEDSPVKKLNESDSKAAPKDTKEEKEDIVTPVTDKVDGEEVKADAVVDTDSKPSTNKGDDEGLVKMDDDSAKNEPEKQPAQTEDVKETEKVVSMDSQSVTVSEHVSKNDAAPVQDNKSDLSKPSEEPMEVDVTEDAKSSVPDSDEKSQTDTAVEQTPAKVDETPAKEETVERPAESNGTPAAPQKTPEEKEVTNDVEVTVAKDSSDAVEVVASTDAMKESKTSLESDKTTTPNDVTSVADVVSSVENNVTGTDSSNVVSKQQPNDGAVNAEPAAAP